MIEHVEQLMLHWGEQCRRRGVAGGCGSPLAGLIEWHGAPPRMGYGSVALVGGGGVDLASAEVDAVLAELVREGERQDADLAKAWRLAGRSGRAPFCLPTQLVKLARARYLVDPVLTVEQQMRRSMITSRRTYDRRVHELHEQVQMRLKARARRRVA
ncbi:hypothetical protein [Atopomonas sediminilitoris]|uniref:hypothetical protein n=1 Tax=Atopomonas sediminilitoris TaxID=2919919 RepID=UPI001F4E8B34|nr:hypothetical protein [Atopomonas sediminilitoris]MCJ8168649.1 hypothetical protein [Atopomonas sediminilitoris]